MKLLLLLASLLVTGVIQAQQPKYITFKYIPPTSPGVSNAQLIVNTSKLKQPVQFYYNFSDSAGNPRIGNETHIHGLSAPGGVHMEVLDSACTYFLVDLMFASDPDSLILLDTIMAVMPTAVGATDGSITYTLLPTLTPTYKHFTKYAGGTTYTYTTNDTSFTGLDQGFYSYKVVDSNDINHYMRYDMILYLSSPMPCDHFGMSTNQYPASPGNCDGVIQMVPATGLADTIIYSQVMTAMGAEFSYVVNDPGGGFNFFSIGKNICPQPVLITAFKHSVSNEYRFFNRAYFMGVDSSATFTWSPPSTSIPSGLDTILLSASYNCSLDYSTPPDTVYIDTLINIGGNLFNFVIVVEQDTTQELISGTIEVDTSGSFFVDFTLYCPDTLLLRSGIAEYKSSRNLVYFGDILLSSNNITKKNSDPIILYPNPSNSILSIRAKNRQLDKIEICDLNGKIIRVIYPEKGESSSIDIRALVESVYIIKITDDYNQVGILRFVKI